MIYNSADILKRIRAHVAADDPSSTLVLCRASL